MPGEFDSVNAFDDDDDLIDIPDTSDAQSKYRVKPGAYPARLVEFEPGQTKAGDPKLVFTFEVDVGGGKFLSLKQHMVTTPAGAFFLGRTLTALKIKAGKVKRADIVGRRCSVELEDHEYNGEISSSIKMCVALPGGANVDPDDDIVF